MMVPQLVSSSTAPTAMLEEARAAESRRDFVSKCCIGLKELREAWGRLRVMEACGIGPRDTARELVREANELVSIVTAIVRNTRQKNNDSLPNRRRNRRPRQESTIKNTDS
jgi:four helix bundle protein